MQQSAIARDANAGELYHWPAGHTGATKDGVVFVEIGPVAEMRAFSQHAKAVFGSAGA